MSWDGRTPWELSLVWIRLKRVWSHPGRGCFNAISDVCCERCCRGRPTESIHLRVIGIHVQWQSVIVYHSYQIDHIQDEKDRAQDRSLWHASDQVRDCWLVVPRRTYWEMDDRYDWNQQSAVSLIPKVFCERSSTIEWPTVTEAADRSRRTRAVRSPRSTAWRIFESTRRTAVSVDCTGGRSASDKYSISWRATRRSCSFERTDRLIGWYELALVAWSSAFFRTGVINASLNWAGKRPLRSEQLNSSAMNGAMMLASLGDLLQYWCWNWSADDDLSGSRRIVLTTSSVFSGRNCWKQTPGSTCVNVGAGVSGVLHCTLATFSAKNNWKPRCRQLILQAYDLDRVNRPLAVTVFVDQICWLPPSYSSLCKEIGKTGVIWCNL